MQGHGLAVARGQDEPCTFSFCRTDCTENIGRRGPLVARRRWPGPAFRPSARDLVLLPDPSFILEPNLYRLARSLFCGCLLHDRREFFLNAAAASSSFAW